ncbi:MAG: hypothetical protein EOO77_39995, partial [Oxalobacteraceae bacterium]
VKEEVEFDLDPRDVEGPAEAEQLVQFLTMLGGATSKEVRLTPENEPDVIIAHYMPALQRLADRDQTPPLPSRKSGSSAAVCQGRTRRKLRDRGSIGMPLRRRAEVFSPRRPR